MQRWSIGHSRSRQGLHSTCSRTTRARRPGRARAHMIGRAEHGDGGHVQGGCDVHAAGVVRQIYTRRPPQVDVFAERCFSREVVNANAARLRSSAAISSHSARSSLDPNSAAGWPSCATASANRSGSHRFAVPNAAPGLTPVTSIEIQALANRATPATRAAAAPPSRNLLGVGNPLDDSGAAQKFEIVKALVPRDLAFRRDIYRGRQKELRPSRAYPMRRGMPASHTSAAASNAFGSRIAVSNRRARRSCAIRHLPARSFHPRGECTGSLRWRSLAP